MGSYSRMRPTARAVIHCNSFLSTLLNSSGTAFGSDYTWGSLFPWSCSLSSLINPSGATLEDDILEGSPNSVPNKKKQNNLLRLFNGQRSNITSLLLKLSWRMGRFWQHAAGYVEVAVQKVGTCVEKKKLKIRLSINSDLSVGENQNNSTANYWLKITGGKNQW